MASGGEIRNAFKTFVKFNRIPDKWKDYAACGKAIPKERLISFKTPLAETYHYKKGMDEKDSVHKGEEFTPSDLLGIIRKNGYQLGLVVDFTNTKRYYQPWELTEQNVEYQKIKCEGRIVPPEKVVSRFKAAILSFFKRFPTSNSLVGVHCTHGLNRAGYIVCRYLIDCKGYEPDEAIEAFNNARGYKMERENYLEDLKTRQPNLISKSSIDKLLRDTTFSDDGEQKEERYERRNADEIRGGGGPDRRDRGWQERNDRKPYERPRTHYVGGQRAKEQRYGNYRSGGYGHRPRSTSRGYEDGEPEEVEYQNSWEHSGKHKGRRGDYNNHRQPREWSTNDYSQSDGGYSQRDDYYSQRDDYYSQRDDYYSQRDDSYSQGDGGYSQRGGDYSRRDGGRYSKKDGHQYDR